MNTPTFKEQFDKITRAYFKDEIEPFDDCACFVGNLLNGNDKWARMRDSGDVPGYRSGFVPLPSFRFSSDPVYRFYSMQEICLMETAFMDCVYDCGEREEKIFKGMSNALDLLRKIHESKGEVIEDFEFQKRELQSVTQNSK